tara:strand:+ start:2421 stop:2732 length:312 start_codon:yes stop_codon:yes gene_type:complete
MQRIKPPIGKDDLTQRQCPETAMGIKKKGSNRYRYFKSKENVQNPPNIAKKKKLQGRSERLNSLRKGVLEKQPKINAIPRNNPAPKSQKGNRIIQIQRIKPRY